MKVTAQDILNLNPCEQWASRIPGLVGKGMTPSQIAATTKVEPTWRYWVLTRLLARTESGRKALVLWACGVAQDVRRGSDEQLDAADTAIQMAVAWAEGVAVSRDELWDAAYAANAAAAYAAYAAAYAAADAAYAAYAAAYAADAAADAYAANAAAADSLHTKWLTELAAALEENANE